MSGEVRLSKLNFEIRYSLFDIRYWFFSTLAKIQSKKR
jgi:hypothetical protein